MFVFLGAVLKNSFLPPYILTRNVILSQIFNYYLYVDDFQIHIFNQNLSLELKTWISKWLPAITNQMSSRDNNWNNSKHNMYKTEILIFFKPFTTLCLPLKVKYYYDPFKRNPIIELFTSRYSNHIFIRTNSNSFFFIIEFK